VGKYFCKQGLPKNEKETFQSGWKDFKQKPPIMMVTKGADLKAKGFSNGVGRKQTL